MKITPLFPSADSPCIAFSHLTQDRYGALGVSGYRSVIGVYPVEYGVPSGEHSYNCL